MLLYHLGPWQLKFETDFYIFSIIVTKQKKSKKRERRPMKVNMLPNYQLYETL